MKKLLAPVFTILLMSILAAPVFSDEQTTYGWQLMTAKERAEHREKMRSLQTAEERERYRMEHHEKMQQRAKEQGVTLPEIPQNQNRGMGFGAGGKGPGGSGR